MKMNVNRKDRPIIYAALGDSLSVGIGAILKPGFVKRYAAMAEQTLGRKVIPFTFAKHGSTSEDVLEKLDQAVIKIALTYAEIITISVGGNDLRKVAKVYLKDNDQRVLHQALKLYHKNIKGILSKIVMLKRNGRKPYIVRLVDFYNPFPNRVDAQEWVKKFHQQLKSFEQKNISVTNVYEAFQGREKLYLFIDKLHPNADGYQVIAEELHKLNYGKLKLFAL